MFNPFKKKEEIQPSPAEQEQEKKIDIKETFNNLNWSILFEDEEKSSFFVSVIPYILLALNFVIIILLMKKD